jgi:drug/metabolite transporter (DMT)-like permease
MVSELRCLIFWSNLKVPFPVQRPLKAHLSLVLVTLVWGCSFVLVKQALADSSPLTLNAVRMALSAVLLTLYYRRSLLKLDRRVAAAGSLVGVFMFLGYAFQTEGLRLTSASKSAFLTGGSTVLVPLFLVVFWRTKIHRWRVAGILLALCGLFLLTVPAGRQGLADFANINRGDVLTIACAVAFAFHIIFIGRSTQRFPFEQISVVQLLVAAGLMSVAAPLLEQPHLRLTPSVAVAILFTGVLGTALAFTVQAWAQQFTPATHAALIFNLEPVFAWIASFLYLHERLGLRAAAGASLILAGVLVSELLGAVSGPDPELAKDSPGGPAPAAWPG